MATRKVAVRVSTRSSFLYGFTTRVAVGDSTILGHRAAGAVANQGIMYGVNSPKPARARKILATGASTSSFVDAAARATMGSSGWTLVKRAKGRLPGSSTRAKSVYVKMRVGTVTINYAWKMPLSLYNAIAGDRAGLKILDLTTSTSSFDVVYGGNPAPPRASKLIAGVRRSTFYDPSATLPAGWSTGSEEE